MEIGKRIYFDKITGTVLAVVGERSGDVVETTIENDITTFKVLNERTRDSFDYIQLKYGAYSKEFRTCSGYHVDTSTKQLIFNYDAVEKPETLQDQVQNLKSQVTVMQKALDEILLGGGV